MLDSADAYLDSDRAGQPDQQARAVHSRTTLTRTSGPLAGQERASRPHVLSGRSLGGQSSAPATQASTSPASQRPSFEPHQLPESDYNGSSLRPTPAGHPRGPGVLQCRRNPGATDAGQTEAGAWQSHCRVTSLQAINVINHLRAQTLAQREWGFSEEHCRVAHYWDSSLDSTACSNHVRQTLQSLPTNGRKTTRHFPRATTGPRPSTQVGESNNKAGLRNCARNFPGNQHRFASL